MLLYCKFLYYSSYLLFSSSGCNSFPRHLLYNNADVAFCILRKILYCTTTWLHPNETNWSICHTDFHTVDVQLPLLLVAYTVEFKIHMCTIRHHCEQLIRRPVVKIVTIEKTEKVKATENISTSAAQFHLYALK